MSDSAALLDLIHESIEAGRYNLDWNWQHDPALEINYTEAEIAEYYRNRVRAEAWLFRTWQALAGGLDAIGKNPRDVTRLLRLIGYGKYKEVRSSWPELQAWLESLALQLNSRPAAPSATLPQETEPANSIRKRGAMWGIKFGHEACDFPTTDYSALAVVAVLLSHRGEHVDFLELVPAETRRLLEAEGGSGKQNKIDCQEIEDFERHAREVASRMQSDNPAIATEATEEWQELQPWLEDLRKNGGRGSKLGQSSTDKEWHRLTTSLRRLYPRIKEAGMPDLAAHLADYISVNLPHLLYNPPPRTARWHVES
jgi:hypothetical protein